MRRMVVSLGLVACGPDVADPQHGGESSATSDPSSSSATLAASTGSDEGDATTSTGSTSSADDAAESGIIFDFGGSDMPDPGDPPGTCRPFRHFTAKRNVWDADPGCNDVVPAVW